MRPKTVASAYVAAAATAPSSSRLRTGSRRDERAREDPGRERRDERRGDGLGGRPRRLRRWACARRRDVGEHPCLGQRENREPRATATERERSCGEHPVGDPPRLHGVPQHGKRAREWGAVHAERGSERAGDLVDREALAGRDVDDVGGEDVRDRRSRRAGPDADHGDERARRGTQHLFVGRRGGLADHADDRGRPGRIAVGAHE